MRSVLLFCDDKFKLYWVSNLSKLLKTYALIDYSTGIDQTVYRCMRTVSHTGYILLPIYKDNDSGISENIMDALNYLDSLVRRDEKLNSRFASALGRRFGTSLSMIMSTLRNAMDFMDDNAINALLFPFLFNSVGIGCYFRFMLFRMLERLAWGYMDYFLLNLHTYLDAIGVNSLYYVPDNFEFNELFTGNDLLRLYTVMPIDPKGGC